MKHLAILFISFLLITSCNSTKNTKQKKATATIDSTTVRKHLYTLASDEMEGRRTGTPGIEKAAKGVPVIEITFSVDVNGIINVFTSISYLGSSNDISPDD